MPIRPIGVTNNTKAAATHHQLTVASHGTGCSAAATLLTSASHVTHCRPVSVASGTDSSTCAACVTSGVGLTSRGSDLRPAGSSSSRKPASEPSRGWS